MEAANLLTFLKSTNTEKPVFELPGELRGLNRPTVTVKLCTGGQLYIIYVRFTSQF